MGGAGIIDGNGGIGSGMSMFGLCIKLSPLKRMDFFVLIVASSLTGAVSSSSSSHSKSDKLGGDPGGGPGGSTLDAVSALDVFVLASVLVNCGDLRILFGPADITAGGGGGGGNVLKIGNGISLSGGIIILLAADRSGGGIESKSGRGMSSSLTFCA